MSFPSIDPLMVGYCTNVHAGKDLPTTLEQLEIHSVGVRKLLQQEKLAVGLWLSNQTAQQLLVNPAELKKFSDQLLRDSLIPYTLNGFPFGDFHQDVVKLEVYKPTWAEPSRLQYTRNLCDILAALLKPRQSSTGHSTFDEPRPCVGTISTLPIGWPTGQDDSQQKRQAAANLLKLAEHLDDLHQQSEVLIKICIEPEPGCILGDFQSTLRFFQDYLLVGDTLQKNRAEKYLTFCYDICHSAVMGESAEQNLKAAKDAGVSIGKVQVSSAITVDFDQLSSEQKQQARQRIQSFAEPRYIHQTHVMMSDGTGHFFNDLPDALANSAVDMKGRWVIHFHVPISESRAGILDTTQSDITRFIAAATELEVHPTHWEVETYAWNVLPADMQRETLAAGIADEIRTLQKWLR